MASSSKAQCNNQVESSKASPDTKVPLWKWLKDCSLDGYSVVFSCVSVGNVAQLAGDLIVSSLGMQHAASIYSPAFVPMCGADPYNLSSSEICGPADLYIHPETSTALIQIRAPILRHRTRDILNEIVDSLQRKRIKEVVILSSSFAHEKHDIMSSWFRYHNNDHFLKNVDPSWLKHKNVENELVIHGGGFAPTLLEICTERSVPAIILYKYVSEGDNRPDAIDSVEMLSRLLPLFSNITDAPLASRLKQPVSWRLLFGGPPPVDMY